MVALPPKIPKKPEGWPIKPQPPTLSAKDWEAAKQAFGFDESMRVAFAAGALWAAARR